MCICAHVQVIHVMIERIPYICPRILNVTMCVRACGMYIFMYVCAFVYIYIYIYIYICKCMYIYISGQHLPPTCCGRTFLNFSS